MHLNPDIFSDIFARNDGLYFRLDPRLKLVTALIAIGCAVLSRNAIFPCVLFALCFAAILALRIPRWLLVLRLASPVCVAAILITLQSALTKGTPLWLLDLVFVKIAFTREGFSLGLMTGARVLGAVSVVLLLSFVTPAHQIFRALHWLRVPGAWVEIAILMYRYIFTLLDQVSDTMAAQRLRLGYLGMRRTLRSAGVVAGTVILRSVDQAVRTHEAMVLRGYCGTLPFEPMPALSRKDMWSMVSASAVIIGLHWVCQRSLL